MRGSPENLAALRHLLAERFPQAAPRPAATLPTGVAAIDEAGGGGLPLGGITEIVALAPSSGGQLLISSLLAATRARRMRAALVDALDAFDPQSHEPPLLQHLVWVRCGTLDEAMHAADILIRDANLALVMVDLRGVASRALRGVPATTWYRLQRALERTDMAMVVFTAENQDIGKQGNEETPDEINLNSAVAASAHRSGERQQADPASTAEFRIKHPKSKVGNGDQGPLGPGRPSTPARPAVAPYQLHQADMQMEDAAPAFAKATADRPSAPRGLVGSARLRLSLTSSFQLDAFAGERTRLACRLPVEVQRRRHDVHEERRIA